jgi:hypothetical protein
MARGEKERAVSEETPPKPPEEPEIDDQELLEIRRRLQEFSRKTDEAMKAYYGRSFTPQPERPGGEGE